MRFQWSKAVYSVRVQTYYIMIFDEQYLNDNQIRLVEDILAGNNQVEKFVLEWCLDNLVPFQEYCANPDRWTLITYEVSMTE